MKPWRVMGLLCALACCGPMAAGAAGKSGVEPQVISLPTGPGSVEGLGESFEPDLNTGTATYGVKIAVSPGVSGHEPSVQLTYNSGYGNSPLGMAWNLNLEYIQRQTDKGLPGYTDSDVFAYNGSGEMVPLPDAVYRLKIEGQFIKFRKLADGWEAWRRNGNHLYFGTTAGGQQQTAKGIFAWYLEKEVDTNGNEIRYQYSADQGAIYLSEIRYSLMSETLYKSVRFVYETRPDPFTSYASTTKVTTTQRLKYIEVLVDGVLARRYDLSYHPGTIFSLLASVTQYGTDGTTALPQLSFGYSTYQTTIPQTVVMSNEPPTGVSPANSNVDLVDINGDALPDLVYTNSSTGEHTFYINDGNGAWQENPVVPTASPPYLLATSGVMMSDMNGDGRSDLFVKNSTRFGYFHNTGNLKWEEGDWTECTPLPAFDFESQTVRMLDLNNDKLIDVLVDDTVDHSYKVWFNQKNNQWSTDFDARSYLPEGAYLSFSNPAVRLGDMNGDRMQDLVYVLDGYLSYFPSMGNGEFDNEVAMTGAPDGLGAMAAKLDIADIDNNGLADIVLVGNASVQVWFNNGNNGFQAPVQFTSTPAYVAPAVHRFADMNGDGYTDLLITNEEAAPRYAYVDFNNGVHPNLLTSIDNGLGSVTTISYAASTEDYLADRAAGKPWASVLPFPMQVVSGVTVTDQNSGQQYVTSYHYRDGYYDGGEKEFRGFGGVRKLETGEASAPALLSMVEFDTGKTEESRKGFVTMAAALDENGALSPPAGLYDRQDNTLATNTLFAGLNGEQVRFSYIDSITTSVYEKTASPVTLYQEFEPDNYGNLTRNFNYGIVNGIDYSPGNDEVLATTTYLIDEVNWMVDRPQSVSATDLNGGFVRLQNNFYDTAGNLIREEHSPDGVSFIPLVRNQYDAYGNIIQMTDANDHCRDITYDATFHTLPVSESICGLGLNLAADYDPVLGKITRYTEYNGHATEFAYDPLGRLAAIVKPGDSSQQPTQSFSYSLGSPVSSVTTQSREQSGTENTYDAVTYYDGMGRKLQTRSEGGKDGWVVTEAVSFNTRREIAGKWLPYFSATSHYQPPESGLATETLRYDPKKRVVKVTNPDATFRTSQYTPLARIEADEEDNGAGSHAGTPHTFINDGLERLIEVRERNGAVTYTTKYGYDGLNNLVRIEDNEGNIKTMVFDGLGRKISMDDPDKHQMTYGYDPAGNLITTTDAKNQTVTYTYDAANRMLTEVFGGVRVRYHYDADLATEYPDMANTLGRVAWVEDEAGREFLSYDERGRVTRRVREAGGKTFDTRMAYDALDRLTAQTYPDTFTVNYRYNERNLLDAVPGFVDRIDYNASGRKTAFRYANGLESTYQYDDRQRLTALRSSRDASALQNLGYLYDRVSNITAITDGRTTKTPENRSRTFQYDDLYRLTSATAADWIESYQYSSIGNMTFKSDAGVMTYGAGPAGPHAVTGAAGAGYTYAYDLNGNIAARQPGFTYQFDHKDRLTQANRESDGAVIASQYDYQGNRKTKSVTVGGQTDTTVYADQYTELRGDSLIKQVYAGDRLVARIYTPFSAGLLEVRTNPLTVADFDVSPTDGVISLEEIRAQGRDAAKVETEEAADALRIYYDSVENSSNLLPFSTMAKTLEELGEPQQVNQGSVYFYLPDHLGSPSMVTDAAGSVVEESVFYPYGKDRKRTGTFDSEYRFTGKELDDETGLHYFGARYYDALTGRFVSVDPLWVEKISQSPIGKNSENRLEQVNLYSYGGNNPSKFFDKNGEEICSIIIGVTGIIAILGPTVALAVEGIIDSINNDGPSPRMINYDEATEWEKASLNSNVNMRINENSNDIKSKTIIRAPTDDEYKMRLNDLKLKQFYGSNDYRMANANDETRDMARLMEYRAIKNVKKETENIFKEQGVEGIRKEIDNIENNNK